mgnify:CR=1 FL=1
MRLTRAGEYAIRCVLYLFIHQQQAVVRRRDIAAAMHIPEPFLGKVAQQLARSGIIEIIQGAKGGYSLLASPEELSLLDVIESVSGKIVLNDCVLHPERCFRQGSCSVHRVWQEANRRLRSTLAQATFASLLEEEHCLSPSALNQEPNKTE